MKLAPGALERLRASQKKAARSEADSSLAAAQYRHALAMELLDADAGSVCQACGELDPPESHSPCNEPQAEPG